MLLAGAGAGAGASAPISLPCKASKLERTYLLGQYYIYLCYILQKGNDKMKLVELYTICKILRFVS